MHPRALAASRTLHVVGVMGVAGHLKQRRLRRMSDDEQLRAERIGHGSEGGGADPLPANHEIQMQTVGPHVHSSREADSIELPREERPEVEPTAQPALWNRSTVSDPSVGRIGDPEDFPEPPAANNTEIFEWNESNPRTDIYPKFGKLLASRKDFYRRSTHGGGLLLAPEHSNAPAVDLDDITRFQAAIADYVRVQVIKDGKAKGSFIPNAQLKIMSRSELFLRELPAVDEVVDHAVYSPPDFRPTTPGYNNRGLGHRVLHIGSQPQIIRTRFALDRYYDTVEFDSPADRANAYAAGVTVKLRRFWPGGKPIALVTAAKSHAGKGTLISCFAGLTGMNSVTYQSTDWAFERSLVGALLFNDKIGVINIDNVRIGGAGFVRSAFLERFLTDPQPFLFSTGTGRPVRCWNNFFFTLSSNEGSFSTDLMNRGLPIKLSPKGDMLRRHSSIGNPKHEYLPRHRNQIDAEFNGMIANWVDAGCPLDTDVHHSSFLWGQTVGGILKANGIDYFLENFDARHNIDDPTRRALGLLGAAHFNQYRTASEWSKTVVDLGFVKALIPEADRDGEKARARGIGVTLAAHLDETFDVRTEDRIQSLKLERVRKRFPDKDEPQTKYQFRELAGQALPTDVESAS